MKTRCKVFYYNGIELLAHPVGNEEPDAEVTYKEELSEDYDIPANMIECMEELR